MVSTLGGKDSENAGEDWGTAGGYVEPEQSGEEATAWFVEEGHVAPTCLTPDGEEDGC